MIAQYFVEFIFYSFLGWVWESIYCTAKEKHWADRGFLFGPVCPIYGSCIVAGSILFTYVKGLSGTDTPVWVIFLIGLFGSAVAEFSTSWVLEKRFHARWWDYSHMPLNIQGRICFPVSCAFGLAGIVVVRYLLPAVNGLHANVPVLVYEIFAIIFAAAFGADYALTEAALSSLLKDIERMHEDFNVRAESTYEMVSTAPARMKESITDKAESVKDDIVDKAESVKEGIVDRAESVKDDIVDRAESMKEGIVDRVELTKKLAGEYAGRMSFSERQALSRIQHFMPGGRKMGAKADGTEEGAQTEGHEDDGWMSPGLRLKEALAAQKLKRRQDKNEKSGLGS